MSKRKAEADDAFSFLEDLEKEVQAEQKQPVKQTISSKPVMAKRTKEEVMVRGGDQVPTWENTAAPPPPSVPMGGIPAPPALPPGPRPEHGGGMIPPPPPSYGSDAMTMPHDMAPSRPAPNPVLPVPKQYSAATDNKNDRPNKYKMSSAGSAWEDPSLHEWPDDDHRIFVGDLGNECNDDLLAQAFQHYKSFQKAKVVREKNSGKSRGYGFVSMLDVEVSLPVPPCPPLLLPGGRRFVSLPHAHEVFPFARAASPLIPCTPHGRILWTR